MAGFDENIVREYFELNGFFVRQLRKHALPSRKKSAEEANELVVYHPQTADGSSPAGFQLFSSDMSQMRGALVAIKGWHHSRFTPAILKSSPKLLDFIKKEVVAKMDLHFQVEADEEAEAEGQDYAGFLKILILPGFPKSEAHREECTELLKAAGVDGVIVFSTILENLLRHVEVNHSYQKSDVLQMLRVLKINDMIREPQMTLFS
ncbi:MAG: hypothetical protein NWT02_05380 [Opitutales bacterium]|jgi:hypothetical protein|nr:hypothetical protein [Opitutales bacterium]MDP5080282.1 hypothetical protein [Opitutales bacterium]